MPDPEDKEPRSQPAGRASWPDPNTPQLPGRDEEVPDVGGLTAAILGTAEVTLFENLYLAHAREAHRYAQAILGDPELAADAVHSGFLEILRYLLGGRRWYDPAEARGLAIRNVRWAALKVRRTRGRAVVGLEPLEASDDSTWARAEAKAICEEIVSQLRETHRIAIRLHFIEGLTNIEAARRLNVTVGVFESRLQRAIRAARRAARSTGHMPQVLMLLDRVQRFQRRRHGDYRRPIPPLRAVAAAAVTTVALCGGFTVVASHDTVSAANGLSGARQNRMTGAGATADDITSIDNAVVLDAVALPQGMVLAAGWEKDCYCLLVFRSIDQGATWEAAAGPHGDASSVTIGVTDRYPLDQRIIIERGDGLPQVSARFGAPFSPSQAPPLARGEHFDACGGRHADPACQGYAAHNPRDGSRGGVAVLRLAARRVLSFEPVGGVLCSGDDGNSWAPRCPAPRATS